MIFVFAGPSLDTAARPLLDATYLPPAAQGDVYKAALQRPDAIALIDGYFDGVPAVWHKEILWALSRGVHVVGGASMGALRAAELASFGMVGVGKVFDAFHCGELEDDDEVAVVHGDAASGYRLLTDAMVDIRRWVADAIAAKVLAAKAGALVVAAAKNLHYRDRRIADILEPGPAFGIDDAVAMSLLSWLERYGVSQKREDARAVLEYMASHDFATPLRPTFVFEQTGYWNKLQWSLAESAAETNGHPGGTVTSANLHDEARLTCDNYREMLDDSLIRVLAGREYDRAATNVDRGALTATIERFRREQGLLKASEYAEWKRANRMFDVGSLRRFFVSQTHVYMARDRLDETAASLLPQSLRAFGVFDRLFTRAQEKQTILASISDSTDTEGPDRIAAALKWFSDEFGAGRADAHRLGFADERSFVIAACREYEFAQSRTPADEAE